MTTTFDTRADAALASLADAITRVDLCNAVPTSYAEATSTYTIGNYTLTAGDGNGDFVIGNGDSSGRKLTMSQQTGNNATGTDATPGTQALAFTDGSSTLLWVLQVTEQPVTSGNPLTLNAVDLWEIEDPS